MEKLRELRDEARQRGQLSAAIQAEVKRGELRRFYVKQVESGDAGEFDGPSIKGFYIIYHVKLQRRIGVNAQLDLLKP